MTKPYDTRLIMMVAQRPFDVAYNQFCKLIPLFFVDGTIPAQDDFPNDGEVWWMLTPQTLPLAEPGRLVIGSVENASRYATDDPKSSMYQVKRDSLQDVFLKDAIEVLNVPADAINDIRDVVSGGFKLNLATKPIKTALLRWRNNLYGPFSSMESPSPITTMESFSFSPADNIGMTVYQFAETLFREASNNYLFNVNQIVSLTTEHRMEHHYDTEINRQIVLSSGYEQVLANNPQKLNLESVERKLMRFAKQCLTKRRRQELQGLLNEVELTGRETENAQDIIEAITKIKQITNNQDDVLDTVAIAMLESGVLGDDRIGRAEQKFAEKYVEEKTAELQARVEETFQMKKEELRRVESELKDLSGTLLKERKQQWEQLSQEISAEREKANQEIAAERLELERQQNLLQQNLEKVTKELHEAGDEVVNKFLTIAPLISAMGVGVQTKHDRSLTRGNEQFHVPSFSLPAFVASRGNVSNSSLKEEEFFDRFRRVVEDSNFTYGLLDLQRFHLSVKCSEITVLGGSSGTGKSSLPALYGQALLGDEGSGGRQGCLMVNISPSWMDIRDLLGHLNTLEGRFYPAESGLFQYLVYAQEEYKAQQSATGLYLTCLDEMNLAQVEHYFSDFMMALDRGGAGRVIQCFAPEVANASCPFCNWGRIDLSPALRFVGTVNFDETTRLLSDRFLDRVNLINIKPKGLPGVAGANSLATASGRMVTMSDFESWRTDGALPSDLGTLLDSMRPLLSQMGCPISPRVYRGICRFVSSSVPVLTAAKAFDVQVAQRIIPKIRSLITRRQLDALDSLLKVINASNICSFDESIPLLEEIRDSAGTRGWNLED